MATKKKKKTTKKAAPAVKKFKFGKVEKTRTKSDVYTSISENTGVAKKDVAEVFN